jgi:hypothetical protein
MNAELAQTAALAVAYGCGRKKFKRIAREAGVSGKRGRKLFIRAKRDAKIFLSSR